MSGRVRRTRFAFFTIGELRFPDVAGLLRGRVELTAIPQLLAHSLLTGERTVVTADELSLLRGISHDEWHPQAGEPELDLARRGLLVSDAEDERLSELRRRDEQLEAGQWDELAAVYHFATRWRGVTVASDDDAALADPEPQLEEALRRYGQPPPHFHSPDDLGRVDLPLVKRTGGLYDVLARRATTRTFDRSRPLSADALSVLLYYVFGCHGLAEIAEGVAIVKKTSPSGGGLHPIEAYPLVLRVEGVAPGVYHYDPAGHSLALLRPLDESEAERLAVELTAGQAYFGSAAMLVLLTGRFYRSFWKYRRHNRAYAVLLMDAGHLSQTFYAVAAELGLGAFVTAAINGADIEDVLGVDGYEEGALAVCGCGVPAPVDPLRPAFAPYVPR